MQDAVILAAVQRQSDFWPAVGAIAAVVAAVAAVVTGVVAIQSLRALRADSTARTRPVMAADLRRVLLAKGFAELVVTNVGPSVARNLRVSFQPPLPDLPDRSPDGQGYGTPYLARRYAQPIATVGPGRCFSNIYGVLLGDGSRQFREPVPTDFTIRFEYEDSDRRAYIDTYELSIDMVMNETTTDPGNDGPEALWRRCMLALVAIARGIGR